MTRRFLAVTFCILVLLGCSSKTKETSNPQLVPSSGQLVPSSAQLVPSSPAPDIAVESMAQAATTPREELDDLAASNWVISNWSTKDLDHPLDARDADIVRVDEGLQITAYGRIGKYRATFRRELLDNFELTATVIQPSEQELRQAGLVYPSPFYIKAGFRDASGLQGPVLTLYVDRNLRETSEIRLRASSKNLSFSLNNRQPIVVRRPKVEPSYFYLELHQDRRIFISSFVVRQGLEPDAALAAAVPQPVTNPEAINPMTPPPAGMMARPPVAFMPPMNSPNGIGMTPPGLPGASFPPPPRSEPLLSCGGWYVPKLGDSDRDQTVTDDLKLIAIDNRMKVEKDSQSEDFWIVRKLKSNADIDFNCRIVLPSFREMSATLDPTSVLGVGVFPWNDAQQSLTLQAPPPLPESARDFDFIVRRNSGRVTMSVAGTDAANSLNTNEELLVGLYVRGGIRFTAEVQSKSPALATGSIEDKRVEPLASSGVASQSSNEEVVFRPIAGLEPATCMAMSEDRKFLVASHQGKNQVSVVDVMSGKVVAQTELVAPHFLLCRGNNVFVASRRASAISVLSQVDNWKVIDHLNVPKLEVIYMSAASEDRFKDELVVTIHGEGGDGSYRDCHNYLLDIRRNQCQEIKQDALVTVGASGLTVVTQKSFNLSPAGGIAEYDYPSFFGDGPVKEPKSRFDEENAPFVYQQFPGGFWLSHQMVFGGNPIAKVYEDPKVLLIPDAAQKMFYAVSDSQIRANRLFSDLPEVGVRPLRFEPPLANSGAIRNYNRRTQDYLLDHPVACTHDHRLTMFILAPDSGQILRAQTTPFQELDPRTAPKSTEQTSPETAIEPINRSAADMIAASERSVVRIETVSDDGKGIGSGFVVDSKGTVITNCHVLAGATSAKAYFSDGRACDIVGTLFVDEARDIVVAKLSASDRAAIKLASELPRKGEAVVGLGAPHGLAFTATRGIVSAIRPAAEMAKELGKANLQGTWVQVDAALSPGNSGGPLVNELGQVVAMSTLASQGSAQNLNFGISAIDVRDALKQSEGRQTIVLRQSVANIRSKTSSKQRSGGGSRNGSSEDIPESAIRKYLADCRESFTSLTRDLRKEIERLSNTLKEMEKGETSIPTAINKVPDIEIVQFVTPQRKTVWFFRSEAVKTRQIERTTARMKNLMKIRSQVKSPKDPESILQLALNFGPKLDARQNQSVGFVSDGTVISSFNAHDVLVIIDETGYLMWLESTAGLDLGEKILSSPVFVNGTATVEVPQTGSRSVTVLRQVSEQEIRDFIQTESLSAPTSNSPPGSPKSENEFRTWADKSGKFSTEAQFVSSDGVKVKLKRRDGKTIEVPKATLSEQDQVYLKSR